MARIRDRGWIRLAGWVLLASVLSVYGSKSSFSQSTGLQQYRNGFSCPATTTIQTSTGLTINFRGADPSDPAVCVWDYARGETKGQARFLYQVHNVGDDSILLDQIRAAYQELFPLAVGKKVEKLVSGPKFNSEMRLVLTVESIVDMNIGADIRHAWLIHQEGFGTLGSTIDMDNSYWLEVGSFVLLKVSEDLNGSKTSFDVINIRTNKLPHG